MWPLFFWQFEKGWTNIFLSFFITFYFRWFFQDCFLFPISSQNYVKMVIFPGRIPDPYNCRSVIPPNPHSYPYFNYSFCAFSLLHKGSALWSSKGASFLDTQYPYNLGFCSHLITLWLTLSLSISLSLSFSLSLSPQQYHYLLF